MEESLDQLDVKSSIYDNFNKNLLIQRRCLMVMKNQNLQIACGNHNLLLVNKSRKSCKNLDNTCVKASCA